MTGVLPLWIALTILSLAIGAVAGALVRADKKSLPAAVLAGGAAFGGTLTLCLTLLDSATATA